jgi:hypothetical protein
MEKSKRECLINERRVVKSMLNKQRYKRKNQFDIQYYYEKKGNVGEDLVFNASII